MLYSSLRCLTQGSDGTSASPESNRKRSVREAEWTDDILPADSNEARVMQFRDYSRVS